MIRGSSASCAACLLATRKARPPDRPGDHVLEFYPQIKWVHIVCVRASGSLVALRGLQIQVGYAGTAQWMPVHWRSHAIDTTLLAAALMLVSILPSAMFANGWLATKLDLLVVYVVLATFALQCARRLFFIAALTTYIFMLGVARMHHPLGWIDGWLA
jgi:uncharacterized membrane protein SirB2